MQLVVYTDGCCSPQSENKIGAWAAILLDQGTKAVIGDVVFNTTHQRMELLAIIKGIEFALIKDPSEIYIYTDSQYAVDLIRRKEVLAAKDYTSKKGKPVQNEDLVKKLLNLLEEKQVVLNKVKAHLKQTDEVNFNRDVDKFARKLLRKAISSSNCN